MSFKESTRWNIIFLRNIKHYLILEDEEFEEFPIDDENEDLVQRNLTADEAVRLSKVLRDLL